MSAIFASFIRNAKQLWNLESSVITTSDQIIYRIPKVSNQQILDSIKVVADNDCFTIITNIKTDLITRDAPVTISPLDAYRGRGFINREMKL